MTTQIFATKIGNMSGKTKTARVAQDLAQDLAWVVAYQADRRRRGVPKEGYAVTEVCRKGHELSIENTGHKDGAAYCLTCREESDRNRRARQAAKERREVAADPSKGYCIHGHKFTPKNTRIDKDGYRVCKTCQNEAVKRSRAKAKAKATYCPKGHEFTPENTVICKDGTRRCRTCKNAHSLAEYQQRKAAKAVAV